MEVIEVEGGVAVFLPECFCDDDSCEFVRKESPLVAKSNHILDAFLTLLLERYGGGVLLRGVRCWYIVRIGCSPPFLLLE